MFLAIDDQKNIIEAKDAIKGVEYYCRGCGNKLTLKPGHVNRPHFAHTAKCPYPPEDSDYMSEWHIRMQSYFPVECREYYFDEGEKHRADVFIKEKNTVIEFQKSPISKEDFERRTLFHLNAGRKMVWIFDESKEEPKKHDRGKLRRDDLIALEYPHTNLTYKWLNHRKCLDTGFDLPSININENRSDYSICLFTGSDGTDVVHRIIHTDRDFGFEYIAISLKQIIMHDGMDVDDFFRDEEYWIANSPYAEKIYEYREERDKKREMMKREKRERMNRAFDKLTKSHIYRKR